MARRRTELVGLNHLPGLLLASEAEIERWVAAGLIPVAGREEARRHGRVEEVRLFDPHVVAGLAGRVAGWRAREEASVEARRAEGRGSRRDGPNPRRRMVLGAAREAAGLAAMLLSGEGAAYRVEEAVELPLLPDRTLPVPLALTVAEPADLADLATRPEPPAPAEIAAAATRLVEEVERLRAVALAGLGAAAEAWREELEAYLGAYDDDERGAILHGIRAGAAEIEPVEATSGDDADAVARRLRAALEALRGRATGRRLRTLREAQVREASGYETYAAIFPVARSLGRRILFLAGPTNSGKTHEALRLAAEAESAEILSPLRLLALEHYERLAAAGLAAGMVTGEERVVPEGATHVARTIETLDLGRIVDVCVVDEAQMLADPSRGWAWTQAIVGAPARLVVLTGAPEAIPLVEHLVAMTGEPLEVRILKRKGELRVEAAPAELERLEPGDALIAFSRADIHDLRARLVKSGRSVATVYGALGPEVRRAEAARFREREAEILVATDAIGMGLNIGPLRRVVFSTMAKFDGVRRRPLQPMEIKQIAGRAGRFGHHDVGLVTALSEAGPFRVLRPTIEGALRGEGMRLRGKAYVRPNQETVISASRVLGTDRLGRILQYLSDTLVAGHPDLRMADLGEVIGLASLLDGVPLPLLDRLSYSIAPVDARDGLAVDMVVTWARQHATHGFVEPPGFSASADLLKLESRARIVTSWLWLAQRYPDIYADTEAVLDLRESLNAEIEQRLVASSVARAKGDRGKGDRKGERGKGERGKGRRGEERGRDRRGGRAGRRAG
jgi:ATP-dependent RNA helicase SUPV3L1/SUV3